MNRIARELLVASLAAAIAGTAVARPSPTTQPAQVSVAAPAGWQHCAERVTNALAGIGREDDLPPLISSDAVIHHFNRPDRDLPSHVCDELSGLSIISLRTYCGIPHTLVSDIAADAKDAALPQPVRHELTPDESSMRHANESAAQWICQTLDPAGGELIGVALLYPDTSGQPDHRLSSEDVGSYPAPQFVLFKGVETARGFAVTKIVYGDPIKSDE
jgi:hypothetical protein